MGRPGKMPHAARAARTADSVGGQGDATSREQLFTVLYNELHRLAQRELRRGAFLTMSPTTLLHETYINLSRRDSGSFPDRARFFAYAAQAPCAGLLIDYVR